MLCEAVVLLFCTFLTSFYVYFTWNNNFWKDRGVPFEKPLFFLGNFKNVLFGRQHFGMMYTDLYRKFKDSPYVGYFKLNSPVLLVRDPEIIKDVLVNNFASFADNDFQVDPTVDSIWATNPFSRTGAAWKESRARWIAGITPAKIKLTYSNMEKRCNMMVEHIKECNAEDPKYTCEGRDMSSKLFMDIVVTGIFGLELNSFKLSHNPFKSIIDTVFNSTFIDGFLTTSFIIMPWLGKLFSIRFVSKENEKSLLKIASDLVALRNDPKMLKNEAYQSMMKNNYQESEDKSSLTKLAGWIFGYLLDGTETSSGLLGLTLYELGQNPKIQNQLLEELNNAAATEGGRISFEELHKLTYLDKIVAETLRMYPPGVSSSRLCTQKPNVPSLPFDIPIGTPITISVYGLHMDPLYYPDPEVFDPERFTEEAKNNRHKFTYLPFGEGPRICLGYKFALTQTKIAIAILIRNFEVRVSSKTRPRPLEMDPNIFIFRPIGGLWLSFHERVKQ